MRNNPGLYQLSESQQKNALDTMVKKIDGVEKLNITVDNHNYPYYKKHHIIITPPVRTNQVANSSLPYWKKLLDAVKAQITEENALIAMPIVGKNHGLHNGVLVYQKQGNCFTYIEHMSSDNMSQQIANDVNEDVHVDTHFTHKQPFGDITTCGFRSLLIIQKILNVAETDATIDNIKQASNYEAQELRQFIIEEITDDLKPLFGFKNRLKYAWTSVTQHFSWDTPKPTTQPLWKTIKWLWWAVAGMIPAAVKGLVRLVIQFPLNLAIQTAKARIDNRILAGKSPGVAFILKHILEVINWIPRSITEPGVIKQQLWKATNTMSAVGRRVIRTLGIVGMIITNLSFWGSLALASGAGIAAALNFIGATIKSIPVVSSFLKTGTDVALRSVALPTSTAVTTTAGYTSAAVTTYAARQWAPSLFNKPFETKKSDDDNDDFVYLSSPSNTGSRPPSPAFFSATSETRGDGNDTSPCVTLE